MGEPLDIRFINHASLLIRTSKCCFVTDPWYLSPAFGGWSQHPSPKADAIRQLLSVPTQDLRVIISHGHDDHLDEFFIQKHLREARFFVPKFKTDGLTRRIERLTGVCPIELSEENCVVDGAILNCFINPDFTNYDAIITIQADNEAVIHANDNWHLYPKDLTADLNAALAPTPVANRHFFVQFGIADCFPLNYPSFNEKEALQLIQSRFEAYRQATSKNLINLGLTRGFYYANQSIYAYPDSWKGESLYEMSQRYLAGSGANNFTQCISGTDVKTGLSFVDSSTELFPHLLGNLEKFINGLLGGDSIRLITSTKQHVPDSVSFQALPHVWARILIGELTLEAITIGGMGLIHKPTDRNISDIHRKISKLAYAIQSKIARLGIKFLLENEKEI